MMEQSFPIMLGSLGAVILVAALLARRLGNEKRDTRLMAIIGSGLSGAALTLSFY